jgi:hypothetical protein
LYCGTLTPYKGLMTRIPAKPGDFYGFFLSY